MHDARALKAQAEHVRSCNCCRKCAALRAASRGPAQTAVPRHKPCHACKPAWLRIFWNCKHHPGRLLREKGEEEPTDESVAELAVALGAAAAVSTHALSEAPRACAEVNQDVRPAASPGLWLAKKARERPSARRLASAHAPGAAGGGGARRFEPPPRHRLQLGHRRRRRRTSRGGGGGGRGAGDWRRTQRRCRPQRPWRRRGCCRGGAGGARAARGRGERSVGAPAGAGRAAAGGRAAALRPYVRLQVARQLRRACVASEKVPGGLTMRRRKSRPGASVTAVACLAHWSRCTGGLGACAKRVRLLRSTQARCRACST